MTHSRTRSRLAALLGGLTLAAGAAGASAATGPALPHRNASYDNGEQIGFGPLQLTLVTARQDPHEIEPTTNVYSVPIGTSGGLLSCPRAHREDGFIEAPFVAFGFPGATLTLQGDGRYGFSKSWTFHHATLIGSDDQTPFDLDLTLTAEVISPREMIAALRAHDGACTTRAPISIAIHRDRRNPPASPQPS